MNSLFPLKSEMFPRSSFSKNHRETALHFYLAHQNRGSIDTWLGVVKAKHRTFVNEAEPRYKLTPLAVAAMARDSHSAKKLLEMGADPKLGASHGWTPLHIAELQGDQEMITVLKAHDTALATIQDEQGLTPSELRARTEVQPAADDDQVFFYRNEAGEVVAGSAAKFRELTGAQFTSRVLVSPNALVGEWLDQATRSESVEQDLLGELDDALRPNILKGFEEAPLYLQKNDLGYGVFAREAIAAGTPLMLYGGKIREARGGVGVAENAYTHGEINGTDVRNLGPLVNDSFPNALFVRISHYDGLKDSTFLIATRDIEPDEEITVDYGGGHEVKRNHTELNPERLEAYFKTHSLQNVLTGAGNSVKDPLRYLDEGALFSYLAGTPSSMLHLLLKGLVKPLDLQNFMSVAGSSMGEYCQTLYTIFLALFRFEDRMCDAMRAELLRINREEPVVLTNYVLGYFRNLFEDPQHTFSWERQKSQLPRVLEAGRLSVDILRALERGVFDQSIYEQFLSIIANFPGKARFVAFGELMPHLMRAGRLPQVMESMMKFPALLREMGSGLPTFF